MRNHLSAGQSAAIPVPVESG